MWALVRNLRLRSAISSGNDVAVSRLLQAGANPECRSTQGFTALMLAASQGSETIIRALVGAGASVNRTVELGHPPVSGCTALMAACSDSSGTARPVEVLLELGADPGLRDSLGNTALDWAKESEYDEIVQTLGSSSG